MTAEDFQLIDETTFGNSFVQRVQIDLSSKRI